MTTTRHPLLVLTSGLIAFMGIFSIATAVMGQFWVLPKFKEIIAYFGSGSLPTAFDMDAAAAMVSTMVLLFTAMGSLLCSAAIGLFFRHRMSWYIALVVMWIMILSSAFSVLGSLSQANFALAASTTLGAVPAALILCLLYLRAVRPIDIVIENPPLRSALA